MSFTKDEIRYYLRYKQDKASLSTEEKSALASALKREGRTPRKKSGVKPSEDLSVPFAERVTETTLSLPPLSREAQEKQKEIEAQQLLTQNVPFPPVPEETTITPVPLVTPQVIMEEKRVRTEARIAGTIAGAKDFAALVSQTILPINPLQIPAAIVARPMIEADVAAAPYRKTKNLDAILQAHLERVGNPKIYDQGYIDKLSEELSITATDAQRLTDAVLRAAPSVVAAIATTGLSVAYDAMASAVLEGVIPPTREQIAKAASLPERPSWMPPELAARLTNAGIYGALGVLSIRPFADKLLRGMAAKNQINQKIADQYIRRLDDERMIETAKEKAVVDRLEKHKAKLTEDYGFDISESATEAVRVGDFKRYGLSEEIDFFVKNNFGDETINNKILIERLEDSRVRSEVREAYIKRLFKDTDSPEAHEARVNWMRQFALPQMLREEKLRIARQSGLRNAVEWIEHPDGLEAIARENATALAVLDKAKNTAVRLGDDVTLTRLTSIADEAKRSREIKDLNEMFDSTLLHPGTGELTEAGEVIKKQLDDKLIVGDSVTKSELEDAVKMRTKGVKRPLKERLKETAESLYTEMVSRLTPLEKLGRLNKMVNVRARLYADYPQVVDNMVNHSIGKVVVKNGQWWYEKVTDGLLKILDPIKEDIDTFFRYGLMKRAIELSERETPISLGIDVMKARSLTARLDATDPRLAKIHGEYVKAMHFLVDSSVESGVLSREAGEAMKNSNAFYVPARRVIDEAFSNSGIGKNGIPFKKIEGSKRPIDNPLYHSMMNMAMVVRKNQQNLLLQEVVKAAESLGEEGRWIARRIAKQDVLEPSDLNRIRDKVVELGVDGFDKNTVDALSDEAIQAMANWVEPFSAAGVNRVIIRHDGVGELWEIAPKLYNALYNGNPDRGLIYNILATASGAKILRGTATQYNPAFTMMNYTRDQITAGVLSEEDYIPFYDGAKGMFRILKNKLGIRDGIYETYRALGGGQDAVYHVTGKNIRKQIEAMSDIQKSNFWRVANPKRVASVVLDYMSKANDVFEQATRIQEFTKGAKKATTYDDILIARLNSKDVTVDFSRGGDVGKATNDFVPFFNAGIQGTDVLIRKMIAHPVRTTSKMIALTTFPAIMIQLRILTDEDYTRDYFENHHSYERDIKWLIPLGKQVNPVTGEIEVDWLSLPKPPGPLAGESVLTERFVQWLAYCANKNILGISENEIHRDLIWDDIARTLITQTATFGIGGLSDLFPTTVGTAVGLMHDTDPFRGIPIEGYKREKYAKPDIVKGSTSEIAIALGQSFPIRDKVDISPAEIDFILEHQFSSWGKTAMGISNFLAVHYGDRAAPPRESVVRSVPIINRFVAQRSKGLGIPLITGFIEDWKDFSRSYNSLMENAGVEWDRKEKGLTYKTKPNTKRIEQILRNDGVVLFGTNVKLDKLENGTYDSRQVEGLLMLAHEQYMFRSDVEKMVSEAYDLSKDILEDLDVEGNPAKYTKEQKREMIDQIVSRASREVAGYKLKKEELIKNYKKIFEEKGLK